MLLHALPNTLGPIATVVAIGLGYLISGVVVVETIFNYPGMGRLMVEAVASRDVPMVQATILLFCAAYILFNLVADVLAINLQSPLAPVAMTFRPPIANGPGPDLAAFRADTVRRSGVSRAPVVGFAIVGLNVGLALVSSLIAPHETGEIVTNQTFAPPTQGLPFGSDYLGRDVLSRMLHGASITIGMSLLATLAGFVPGLALGLLAATTRRLARCRYHAHGRCLDFNPTAVTCSLAHNWHGVVLRADRPDRRVDPYSPRDPRRTRACHERGSAGVRRGSESQGRDRGGDHAPGDLAEHDATARRRVRFANDISVLLVSSLSFLGLGLPPPTADWGTMVRENLGGLYSGAPALILPALAIGLLTIGINVIVDWMSSRSGRQLSAGLR